MKPYKLVIFDWDGTLMDSAAKIISCMQWAARNANLPVPSPQAVSSIIGISLEKAIQILMDLSPGPELDAMVAGYKQAYVESDSTPCLLFPGVTSMLASLQANGVQLAVATGKARRGLDRAWRNTDTGHFFSVSRTADDAASKPSSEMLEQLLLETGIAVEDAVMIGDTTYDMQMAEHIGMDRIGVSYGVHAQVELEKHHPVAIVHSVFELDDFLNKRAQ